MLYHQTASDFCWQTSPFGSPCTKLLCQEHARQSPAQVPRAGYWEHPPPTLQPARPRERGEPGTPQKPPPPRPGKLCRGSVCQERHDRRLQMCPLAAEAPGAGGGNPSDP